METPQLMRAFFRNETVETLVFRNPTSKSLLIHLAFLLLVLLYLQIAPKYLPKEEPITVDLVQSPPKEKDEKNKNRIVQKSDGKETEVAKKDAYLSDKTRVTEEERSARNSGEFAPQAVPMQAHKENSKPQKKSIQLSDIGVKLTPKESPDYNQERNWAPSQTGETVRGGEYIHGMKEGEVSALNTKEFIFFSFFERMRRQLDQSWQPLLREQIQRIYKNGRKLASNTDYVTRTKITLNRRGEIVRVRLEEESGTIDLDQVAIDALNKAGPYPNPPKGLIDSSGTIEVRWDFVLRT